MEHDAMAGMDMSGDGAPQPSPLPKEIAGPVPHGPNHHGPGNSMVPMETRSRLDEPGIGLEDSGRRELTYADLKSLAPDPDYHKPDRVIELHLTGNMDRFMWSFDGKKYSDAGPIVIRYGERVRFILVNDTMMNHPIHLHGFLMNLVNGSEAYDPKKHTFNVKPAERLAFDFTADNPGRWAFHCHLLYHMDTGMFREVRVLPPASQASR
jgi:FtsP/CotA-like multicopper oxidase with cupredoxin domain